MITEEMEIEDLARSVTCPICEVGPGEKCRYSLTGDAPHSQTYSHLGRLKAACDHGNGAAGWFVPDPDFPHNFRCKRCRALARGMTVQSDNGKHYAFCVRCRWESPRQGYTIARRIARQPCPVCNPENTMRDLTFQEVSAINGKRAGRWHSGFPNHEDGWTGADWSNAAQGEGGELAEAVEALVITNAVSKHLGLVGNLVKKIRRIDTNIQQAEQGQAEAQAYEVVLKEKLAQEIGDVYLYLDLLSQFYGLDIAECITDTFNRVSVREGFPEVINRG